MPASSNHKHKEKNVYRFKSFSELLTEVNVDAIHQIKRVELPEETEDSSKFSECLLKWKDLDLTLHFASFQQEISTKCQTYKLVVHYRNDLFEALEKHLQVDNTLALQALLEHLVALCVDLGPDFYPKFSTFFPILTKLLNLKDTKQLEWIFTTLSLLFRNLWRYMINDIENVLEMYSSLLVGHHPNYVGSFAAESISFLLRKARDHKLVLQQLFSLLKKYPAASDSLGKVLFHMLKTSQNQFHSACAKIFPIILSFLRESFTTKVHCQAVFLSINFAVRSMAEHTRKQFAKPIWNIFMDEVEKIKGNEVDFFFMNHLINLLNTWCEIRNGSRIVDEKQLINVFNTCVFLLNQEKQSKNEHTFFSSLCRLVLTVLNAAQSSFDLSLKKQLISTIMEVKIDVHVLFGLWHSLSSHVKFDEFCMQTFLKFCQQSIQTENHQLQIIQLLVKCSLVNCVLPQACDDLLTFKPRLFEFSYVSRRRKEEKPEDVVKHFIEKEKDWSSVWYSLVALFSVRPLASKIENSVTKLVKKLVQIEEHDDASLAVLSMSCLILVKLNENQTFKFVNSSAVVGLIRKWHSNKHAALAVEVILSKNKDLFCAIEHEDCSNLRDLFEQNMSSPDRKLRQLTLTILQHIDSVNATTYQNCLCAEKVPATVQECRTKVLHFSKLQNHTNLLPEFAKRIVVRCLFSNFFINFTPLWQPVQNVLTSYAVSDTNDIFWSILFELLQSYSDLTSNHVVLSGTNSGTTPLDADLFSSVTSGKDAVKHYTSNEKIDFVNYRLLLWKTLCMLPHPEVLEEHSSVLVNLVMGFLNTEFFLIDKQLSLTQNIPIQKSNGSVDLVKPIKKDSVIALLVKMFEVFARFSAPSSVLQSDQLWHLYHDFLTHTDMTLQKAAMECILSYKNKMLNKYKELLFSFLDDKKFQDAITHFEINDFSDEERVVVLPVLLRVLLGKFKSKKGLCGGGKSSSVVKRSLIVRFLSVMDEDEMRIFVRLALEPYSKYLVAVESQDCSVDAQKSLSSKTKIMPIGRQQGVLQTIQLLITENNHQLKSDIYSYLLNLLLRVNSANSRFIDLNSAQSLIPALRNVKKHTTECLLALLKVWPDSAGLNENEVDLLFDVQVWPDLPKLLHESSGSPGLLLKMLRIFAENLKCTPLLAKSKKSDETGEYSPLSVLVSLLNSSKISSDVSSFIIDLLLDLCYQNPTEGVPMDSTSVSETLMDGIASAGNLTIDISPAQTESRFQFALTLLIPHIKNILLYFFEKMQTNKKGFLFPPQQLEFLSAISKVLTEESILSDLSDLLLGHILVASNRNRESSGQSFSSALQTLSDVMREPKNIGKLSKLFAILKEREPRLTLVSILKKACENSPEFSWTCDIVERLNAWDKRRLGGIDFESRLTAFQDIIAFLKGDDFRALFENECVLFLPIMHTCIHTFLTYFSDISMRESVSRMLEFTVKRVNDLLEADFQFGFPIYEHIIKNLLLDAVRLGINSTDEACRNESIKMLSTVVSAFPNEPTLAGLIKLRNINDPEGDIFENLKHIQVHRKARAFRKLAALINKQHCTSTVVEDKLSSGDVENNADSMECDQSSTPESSAVISFVAASKYLLPLAIRLLHTHNFTDVPFLRDACIDLVKSCASIMPWPTYRKMLFKHINGLKDHVITLDIVCAILEVFPFDVSKFDAVLHKDTYNMVTVRNVKDDTHFSEMEVEEPKAVPEKVTQKAISSSEVNIIVTEIAEKVLPKLKNLMASKKDNAEHKLAGVLTDVANCQKRLPLAIPIVSLLKKMPAFFMKAHLPSVLLKIFAFLRSKLHDIRMIAKDTTVKVVKFLGPSYLFVLLKQLKASLARGFQRHVLVNVVSAVLNTLVPMAEVGVFDESLSILQDVLNDGLFGEVASEKLVEKLKAKIPEAKGRNKAYSAYCSIAKFVGKESLSQLIQPLKLKLDQTHKHDVKKVVQEVLGEIAAGLLVNAEFKPKDVLAFTYGLITQNLSSLFVETKPKSDTDAEDSRRLQSCLILSKAPKRYGSQPTKKVSKTNLHLLVEFAMKLLHVSLKRQTINIRDQEHLEMLDPFIGDLARCLTSTHLQTVVCATRCLTKLFKADLPELSKYSKKIIPDLFKILRDHTKGAGNQGLAHVSFKCISKLCFSDYGKDITLTQLQVLLAYAEEDLHDGRRQGESFTLIRSVLKRGLRCDQVIEVIKKVEKIAIQAHGGSARAQARSLCLYFLLNYPLSVKNMTLRIEFLLTQLNFEYEDGRMSVLELLSSIVLTFPDTTLLNHAGVLFVPTAAVMINDESAKCRKAAAGLVKLLIKRLDQSTIDELFTYVMHWYSQDDKILHERLGAMLLCIFIEVEEVEIQRHLSNVFPALQDNLEKTLKDVGLDDSVKATDHTLFYHLSVVLSILRCCPMHLSKFQDHLLCLFDKVEPLLTHPHDWVQLISSQIFGCVFATWDPSELSSTRVCPSCPYKPEILEDKLSDLCKIFCLQLKTLEMQKRLADQVLKNLLFLVRVFDNDHFSTPAMVKEDPDFIHKAILYALRRLVIAAKLEQTNDRRVTTKRVTTLKFCAAFCLNVKHPERVLHLLLDPVYRCINVTVTTSINPEIDAEVAQLKVLSEEVLEVVKSKVGRELFTRKYRNVSQTIANIVKKRKERQALQLVQDPIKAVSLKIKRNERTKQMRKRKFALKRPDRGLALAKRAKKRT